MGNSLGKSGVNNAATNIANNTGQNTVINGGNLAQQSASAPLQLPPALSEETKKNNLKQASMSGKERFNRFLQFAQGSKQSTPADAATSSGDGTPPTNPKNDKELKKLVKLWEIKRANPYFHLSELSHDNANALKTALSTFPPPDQTLKKQQWLPGSLPGNKRLDGIGGLNSSVRTAFASGRRDWIEAYKTLARLKLIDPNARDNNGDTLLLQVVTQYDVDTSRFETTQAGSDEGKGKGKGKGIQLDTEDDEPTTADDASKPFSPVERLQILLDSGATLSASGLDGTTLIQKAADSGHEDMIPILNQVPETAWETWAEAGGTSGGDRATAVQRMKAWVKENDVYSELDLSGLGLDSLPPELPKGLERLDASNNRLRSLPEELPEKLRDLSVDHNQLSSLPAHLPETLTELIVDHNLLSSLPVPLPDKLRRLKASHNQLTSLPENLPAQLDSLNVEHNQLTRLPDNLPAKLVTLWVSHNQLTRLPDNLPASIRILEVEHNRLPPPV